MARKLTNGFVFIALLIALSQCIEDYTPPDTPDQNMLVVDGFLDGSTGSCRVKLTRSQKLGSQEEPNKEIGALVRLEKKDGEGYTLSMIEAGVYEVSSVSVQPNQEFRITIETQDGKEYFSDYTRITNVPAIDSVTWAPVDEGVEIQVTTHDPTNTSRYYQWNFEETWQYTSAYEGVMIYNEDGTVGISTENIYNCWQSESSTAILIESSEKLEEDVIYKKPLLTLPKSTDKYIIRYSVLVKQRVLTEEAYYFWLQMQKNTENLGTLFDPMPSQVIGNIHSAGGSPVLGYFSAGKVSEKRMFLTHAELPDGYPFNRNFPGCEEKLVLLADLPNFDNSKFLLTDPVTMGGIILIGYEYSTHNCVDCRKSGGTNSQPDFW